MKYTKVFTYILSRILSYFLMVSSILILFIFVLQIFRVIDLLFLDGGSSSAVFQLLKLLVVLAFPIVLPTALLISLFLAYKNLLSENELIAFSSIGVRDSHLVSPGVFFACLISGYCYLLNTQIAPTAHIKSSMVENKLKATAIQSGLKPGAFSNYDNTTFYLKDRSGSILKDIFIHNTDNESKGFAESGLIKKYKEDEWRIGFNLSDGRVLYQRPDGSNLAMNFKSYEIFLPLNKKNYGEVKLYNLNQTNSQIHQILDSKGNLTKAKSLNYHLELTKRLQISLAPLIFALIMFTFGFTTFQRENKALKYNFGVGLGMSYWILFFLFDSLAFKHGMTVLLFLPNAIYIFICLTVLYSEIFEHLKRRIFHLHLAKHHK